MEVLMKLIMGYAPDGNESGRSGWWITTEKGCELSFPSDEVLMGLWEEKVGHPSLKIPSTSEKKEGRLVTIPSGTAKKQRELFLRALESLVTEVVAESKS
jgi:hypothetical protein